MKLVFQKAFVDDILPRDVDTPFPDLAREGDEPLLNRWLDIKGAMGTVYYCIYNGASGMDHMNIDIIEGGHGLRYDFIPVKPPMIWIMEGMSFIDQTCVSLHEAHEFYRMWVMDWPYEAGHSSASKAERKLRTLFLKQGVVIPTIEAVVKMLTLELNGKDSYPFMEQVCSTPGPVSKWISRVKGSRELLINNNKRVLEGAAK